MLVKKIDIDLISDVGIVRQSNEDMFLVGNSFYRDCKIMCSLTLLEENCFAVVVADGLGGHRAGAVASAFVLNDFKEFISRIPPYLKEKELIEKIDHWVKITHKKIKKYGKQSIDYDEMGTTFCGLLFYEGFLFTLNIGDSRIYRFRNMILKQMTVDHSMRELIGNEYIPSNMIYNSLGAGESVFIDINNISTQCLENDRFLIASDGLFECLSNEEIEQFLIESSSASSLFNKAIQAGTTDNISILLVTVNQIENNK